jgi:hypothetical protein
MAKPRSRKFVEGTGRKTGDGMLDVSGATIVMDYEHHAVHEGLAYQVNGSLDIGAGGSAALEFRVPAKVQMHVKGASVWTNAGELCVCMREDPTVATPGTTPVKIIRRNRANGSARDPLVGCFSDCAGITEGETLDHPRLGGGGVGVAASSDRRTAEGEWVLGGHSDPRIYTIEFENQDNVERRVSYTLFWYEVEEED